MKVTVNTPRQMVIDNTPWIIGLGSIAAILLMTWVSLRAALRGDLTVTAVVGLCAVMFPGGMVLVLEREQLILDRDLGQVVVRRRSLLKGYIEKRFALDQLRGATMFRLDRPKTMRGYRMVLALGPPLPDRHANLMDGAEQVVPFPVWTDEGTALRLVQAVQTWLADGVALSDG